MIHEVQTLNDHTKDIPHEQTEFSQMNLNSLSKWIAIAKKVIRSVRRKMRNDRQHRITKFFPINKPPKKEHRHNKSHD